MWYEFFKYALFGPGVRALWHPRVIGEENIPAEGGVILACNHIAALDPIIVASMIDRKLTYPAKKELFAGDRGFWSKVVAWFLRAVDQVPRAAWSASSRKELARLMADSIRVRRVLPG